MTPAEIKALVERLEDPSFKGPMQHLRDWSELDRLHDQAATALRSFMDGGWRGMTVATQEGAPPTKGSYIAYVDQDVPSRFAKRIFLIWDGQRWFYFMSDQRHRAFVYGWIGPLPAMKLYDLPTPPAVEGEAGE